MMVWVGFLAGIVFGVLDMLATPLDMVGTSGSISPMHVVGPLVPALQSFGWVFTVAHLVCIAIIAWGCVDVLKAKNRSLWWILLLIPALAGLFGMLFVIIIFMLKDKSSSATLASDSTAQSATPATGT